MANILIVDDSRTSRKILRRILEEAEHTIVGEAVNGEDGYLKYQELKPDVVTLDITMPKMDGLEALRLIKKYDADATAIMITAAGQKEKMILAIILFQIFLEMEEECMHITLTDIGRMSEPLRLYGKRIWKFLTRKIVVLICLMNNGKFIVEIVV